MYRRFKDALVAPANLLNYKNDKWYIALLYFLFLAIVSIIPSLAMIGNNVELDSKDKLLLRQTLKMVDLPFIINDDYKLESIDNDEKKVVTKEISKELSIIITADPNYKPGFEKSGYVLIGSDGIHFNSYSSVEILSYKDYESLKGLDFIGATNDKEDFWKVVFECIDRGLEENSLKINTINIIIEFVASIFSLLLLSLIFTLFQGRFTKQSLNFGKRFKLVIYMLFPYAISMVLTELFGAAIFFIIGLIITVIYSSKLDIALIKEEENEL